MTFIFNNVEQAPRDPILGLNEQYNADSRPTKVNLGIGVYCNDQGQLPVLNAVRVAEQSRLETIASRGYLPIHGLATYNQAVQDLIFGKDSNLIAQKRVLTIQALGGTGALKIGADFLYEWATPCKVYISDPSWENHRALFENAGFEVETYPYYDPKTHGFNFEEMLGSLNELPSASIVVLHACCHNPTGIDPNLEQWKKIAEVFKNRELIAFMDMAYQGFDQSLEQDTSAIKLFADMGINLFISSSFSKSFSLYGERVGALTLITEPGQEQARVLSQIKRVIRTNYSNPPTYGASLVSSILSNPELYQQWKQELTNMRERIQIMRKQLVDKLAEKGHDFSFVLQQRGMFSYSGLTPDQVLKLQIEYGIYTLSSGRICIAALNSHNIDYVVNAIDAISE